MLLLSLGACTAQFSLTTYMTADCTGDPYSIFIDNMNFFPYGYETSGQCQTTGTSASIKYLSLPSRVIKPPVIFRPSALVTYFSSPPCNVDTNPFNIASFTVTYLNSNGAPGLSVFSCNGTNGELGFTEKKPDGGAIEHTDGGCAYSSYYNRYAITQCSPKSTQ
jgi:hypothetical protein